MTVRKVFEKTFLIHVYIIKKRSTAQILFERGSTALFLFLLEPNNFLKSFSISRLYETQTFEFKMQFERLDCIFIVFYFLFFLRVIFQSIAINIDV